MLRRSILGLPPILACVLAACGGDRDGERGASASTSPAGPALPALARPAAKPGEFVFHADSSPATHGPIALDGRYLVRFEQTAPEDPRLDFSTQTPFTAVLERRAGDPSGAVKLFSAAARSGRRELAVHGRYVLDVTFGDFPYAVRFTPRH